MGFSRFKFSKLWTSATDFPTVETDEARVRADMQLLHDEAKNGLNGLMDSLEDQGAAGNLGAVDPDNQSKSTVQTLLNQLSKNLKDALTMSGNLPLGGTTGQVLRKSSDNNYETEWGAVPEDQLPAHLTRNNQLKAQTAALFGLDETAVPDDVLAFLGKYNKHWWTKREYTPQSFTLGEVTSDSAMSIGNAFTYSCSYSDTIEVDHNGTVELAGNVTTESFMSVSQAQQIFDSIKGKYFKTNVPDYTYIAYRTQTSAIVGYGSIAAPHQKVTGQPSVIGAMLSYEISNEPDTFPVNDAVDSVWYTYLGVPFDNAVAAPKIQTGSYIGTGTYGKENPNTLSFNFLVKLILITGSWGNSYTQRYTAILNVEAGTYSGLDHIGNHEFSGTIVRNEDEVSWYNNYNAAGQGNVANSNYTYIAIG